MVFLDQLIGNTYHGFTGKIKQKFKPIDIFLFRMILKW